MAQEFVRTEKDIQDISKRGLKFIQQNDIVSTEGQGDKEIFIRNNDKLVKISEAVTTLTTNENLATFKSINDKGETTVGVVAVGIHLAWASSVDGKTGFTTTKPKDPLAFLGLVVDFNNVAPEDSTVYQWFANPDYNAVLINKNKTDIATNTKAIADLTTRVTKLENPTT